MDVLKDARKELVTQLLTQPPPGYRARVIVLAVLWALLLIQSLAFLVIWCHESRRQGRSLKVIRIQKTAGGSIISLQALCAFSIITVVMSVLGCVREGIIYACYFKNADRYLETLFYVLIQTCAVWAAAAFMFSHLSATILLFGGRTHSMKMQKIWIPIYNAVFVILPLVFLGVTLSIATRILPAEREMYKAGKTVLPLIDSILADPALLTLETLGRLQALQTVIRDRSPKVITQRKAMCILAIVYSLFYAVASLAGLWLIKMLRESTKANTHVLYGSHNPGSNKLDGQEEPNETRSTSRPRTAVIPHVPKSRLDDDTTALHRLLANLQASVPLCLLLTIYFPIALSIIYAKGASPHWGDEEFRNDLFAWPWTLVNNSIFAVFLLNTWRASGRNMTSRPSGLGAEASTSSQRQARNQSTSLGQDIVNIQLECAYPPAIEAKDSETGTVAEKMSREIAASERKQYPWD